MQKKSVTVISGGESIESLNGALDKYPGTLILELKPGNDGSPSTRFSVQPAR